MAVTFDQHTTTTPDVPAQQGQLTAWIRARQHAYAGADGPGVHPIVRPAIVFAEAHGQLDDQTVRTALRKAGVPLPDRRQFGRIARGARQYVRAERALSAPAAAAAARADVRLRIARRGVGRLLAPTPMHMVWTQNEDGERVAVEKPVISARRMVTARRAFALIVVEMLAEVDAGRVGRAVSITRIAVQLGVKEDTARRAVRTLAELGWIKWRKNTKRGVGVYRLRRLDAATGAIAAAHREAVDALADDVAESHPVAAAIAAARQPGWGWLDDAPANAWLVSLLDTAGIRGRAAGRIGGPIRPGQTRAWLAAVVERGDGDLVAGLAALCAEHGVNDRIRARLVANAQAQAEDAARVAAAKERGKWRGKARRLVTRVVREEAEAAGVDVADLSAADALGRPVWAARLQKRVAGMDLEPELREALAYVVAADLRKAAVEDGLADAGARWVAGLAAVA